jgi:hypothetical protein
MFRRRFEQFTVLLADGQKNSPASAESAFC